MMFGDQIQIHPLVDIYDLCVVGWEWSIQQLIKMDYVWISIHSFLIKSHFVVRETLFPSLVVSGIKRV